MDSSRASWEVRAQGAGSSLSGVLFKGFRLAANQALHDWHTRLVTEVLAPRLPETGMVLDLGCGYGRLAQELRRARPGLTLVGQDLSLSYCRVFQDFDKAVVQARLGSLPFASETFVGAMAVTSLMYASRSDIRETLIDIRRVLRPGAPLLLVDPGEELRAVLALIKFRAGNADTGGVGFRRTEYLESARDAGFGVLARGGNPRDTIRFLMTGGARLGWHFASRLLRADSSQGGYSRFALHRWLLLQSPETS